MLFRHWVSIKRVTYCSITLYFEVLGANEAATERKYMISYDVLCITCDQQRFCFTREVSLWSVGLNILLLLCGTIAHTLTKLRFYDVDNMFTRPHIYLSKPMITKNDPNSTLKIVELLQVDQNSTIDTARFSILPLCNGSDTNRPVIRSSWYPESQTSWHCG